MNPNEIEFCKKTLAKLQIKANGQKAIAEETQAEIEMATANKWIALMQPLSAKLDRQRTALNSTIAGIKEIEETLKREIKNSK